MIRERIGAEGKGNREKGKGAAAVARAVGAANAETKRTTRRAAHRRPDGLELWRPG